MHRAVLALTWPGYLGFGSLNSFELPDGKYILEIGNCKHSTSNSYYGAGFDPKGGDVPLLRIWGNIEELFIVVILKMAHLGKGKK